MKSVKIIIALFFIVCGKGALAAEKLDNFLIYGDNFTVSVKEPNGWTGDSTNASSYRENLVFYPNNENIQNAKTVIRVLVAAKTDENTMEDLKFDMESYRKQYPKVQFKDVSVKHAVYETYPKLFYVDNSFYEYVTYLNPGKNYRYNIIVSMKVQKTEASKEDMQAYSSVIESIRALK
jgi:phosphatidylserine decarboxylase